MPKPIRLLIATHHIQFLTKWPPTHRRNTIANVYLRLRTRNIKVILEKRGGEPERYIRTGVKYQFTILAVGSRLPHLRPAHAKYYRRLPVKSCSLCALRYARHWDLLKIYLCAQYISSLSELSVFTAGHKPVDF